MQTNNKSGNASKIAWSQEDRDLMVEGWGVKKPYVLFARHQNMGDNWGKTKLRFPIRNNRRFNEMVVYPQIQESLIVIKRMSNEALEQAITTTGARESGLPGTSSEMPRRLCAEDSVFPMRARCITLCPTRAGTCRTTPLTRPSIYWVAVRTQ